MKFLFVIFAIMTAGFVKGASVPTVSHVSSSFKKRSLPWEVIFANADTASIRAAAQANDTVAMNLALGSLARDINDKVEELYSVNLYSEFGRDNNSIVLVGLLLWEDGGFKCGTPSARLTSDEFLGCLRVGIEGIIGWGGIRAIISEVSTAGALTAATAIGAVRLIARRVGIGITVGLAVLDVAGCIYDAID